MPPKKAWGWNLVRADNGFGFAEHQSIAGDLGVVAIGYFPAEIENVLVFNNYLCPNPLLFFVATPNQVKIMTSGNPEHFLLLNSVLHHLSIYGWKIKRTYSGRYHQESGV